MFCCVAGWAQPVNRADIERLQNSPCAIILGKQYVSYQAALDNLGLEKLEARRVSLSSKFSKKAYKSTKHSSWFIPYSIPLNTRRKVKSFREAKCRTRRFQKSALLYLNHLLNIDPAK